MANEHCCGCVHFLSRLIQQAGVTSGSLSGVGVVVGSNNIKSAGLAPFLKDQGF